MDKTNFQQPLAVEKVAPPTFSSELSVEEIFYTIQGEGPLSGQPACFVRLAGCTLQCRQCVVGSTKIALPDGRNKRIKDVKIGDWVFCFNQKTQQIETKQVTDVFEREVNCILKITCTGTTQLFITEEHPVYVVGKGWVEAQDLRVGDVLFHITPSDKMKINNPSHNPSNLEKGIATKKRLGIYEATGKLLSERWKNPEYGRNVRERMRTNNPMWDDDVKRKSWTNRKHTLSYIEKQVLSIANRHDLPIKFVGDGSLWIGSRCPDFQVIGTNKVIEVWDVSHSQLAHRDENYKKERKEYFAKFGYECLFLAYHQSQFREKGDPKGFGKTSCEAWILKQLVEYIHNGNKVIAIEIIHPGTNPKAYVRLAGSLNESIKVYNLEVEDNSNYFANSILVHNCDSYFSSHVPFSIDQVMSAIEKIVPKHVSLAVVTGGEPFRQYYMPQLVKRLLYRFATVQLETSGSCYQKQFDPIKWQFGNKIMIVCSPKTAKLHSKIIPLVDAYKYVVRAGHIGNDGLPDEEPQQFKKVPVAKPEPNWTGMLPPIYISPWDEHNVEKNLANVQAAVQSCLQHGYTLSLQTHKIVNLP